ncbi:hypothetical protein CR513_02757, partial [Mucuna pruriens]
MGEKVVIKHLSLRKVCKDQMNIRIKRQEERKEKSKTKRLEKKKERKKKSDREKKEIKEKRKFPKVTHDATFMCLLHNLHLFFINLDSMEANYKTKKDNLIRFVLYAALLGNVAPRDKSIWCSIPLKGGNPRDMSSGNTSLNSSSKSFILIGKETKEEETCNNMLMSIANSRNISTQKEVSQLDSSLPNQAQLQGPSHSNKSVYRM